MAQIPPNIGELGDVKFSLLPPKIFKKRHGEGWELLQGQNIQGMLLAQLIGLNRLPDGRGMFIRAMNESRTGELADGDGNRQIGSVQKGSIGKHKHPIHDAGHSHSIHKDGLVLGQGGADIRTPKGLNAGGGYYGNTGYSSFGIHTAHANISILENDGIETRPNNIALYLYVKIR